MSREPFDPIDDQDLPWASNRLELQSELLLKCDEQRRAVRVKQGRFPARQRWQLIRVRRIRQLEFPSTGQSRSVDHAAAKKRKRGQASGEVLHRPPAELNSTRSDERSAGPRLARARRRNLRRHRITGTVRRGRLQLRPGSSLGPRDHERIPREFPRLTVDVELEMLRQQRLQGELAFTQFTVRDLRGLSFKL